MKWSCPLTEGSTAVPVVLLFASSHRLSTWAGFTEKKRCWDERRHGRKKENQVSCLGEKGTERGMREIEKEKRKHVGKNVQRLYQRIVHLLPIKSYGEQEIQEWEETLAGCSFTILFRARAHAGFFILSPKCVSTLTLRCMEVFSKRHVWVKRPEPPSPPPIGIGTVFSGYMHHHRNKTSCHPSHLVK